MEAAAARAMPRLLRIYSNDEGVHVAAKLAINNLARLNDELHAFAATHPVDELLDRVSLAHKRSRNRLLSSPSATPPLLCMSPAADGLARESEIIAGRAAGGTQGQHLHNRATYRLRQRHAARFAPHIII